MWWLIAFVIFLVAEIATVSLTSIWFAVGALLTFVFTFVCDVVWVQILVFLVVSLIMVLVTRPLADKYLNQSREKTNIDAIVGKTAVVTEDIDNLQAVGEVRLAGQDWMARSEDDSIGLAKGTQVVVKEVRGVKLIVQEKKEELS